jgi:hypothetical protein
VRHDVAYRRCVSGGQWLVVTTMAGTPTPDRVGERGKTRVGEGKETGKSCLNL